MTVTKEKVRAATLEQRKRAVEMVALGATLREAAAAVGVSHQTVSNWEKEIKTEPYRMRAAPAARPIAQGPRKPVYVNGVRLGRLALWT